MPGLDQPEPPATLRATPRNVLAAALLAVTGGMLDAIVWILHGHVFASAMTGNTVLLGVSLLAHDNKQAVRHLIPLFTFSFGIVLGWSVLRRVPQVGRAHSIALAIQIAALGVAGAVQASFPSSGIVMLVALTASVQNATFQHLDNVSYNSTFITGNIRTLLEAAVDRFSSKKHEEANRQLQAMGPICAGFFVGVLAGAFAAPRLHDRSLWVVDALLLTVFALLHAG